MRYFLSLLIWMCLALPTLAQDQAVEARMVSAFEDWLGKHEGAKGTLAISYKGQAVSQHGVGLDANTPMEMASLSKAITGVCVAEIVAQGGLTYDARFADIVGRGPDITVAQLLNHTSGLTTDSTQAAMQRWLGDPRDKASIVVDAVIERGGPKGEVGSYFYNNENYALLARMIEEATGTTFDRACASRVLVPAQVVARISPKVGNALAWGGWMFSARDYAKFHTHWFGPDSRIGADPFALPNTDLGGGTHYGHGMFFRAFQGGHNFWHFGSLCFPDRYNVGSFAVIWKGEWSAVAAYDACVDWDAMFDLDGALARAVFQ